MSALMPTIARIFINPAELFAIIGFIVGSGEVGKGVAANVANDGIVLVLGVGVAFAFLVPTTVPILVDVLAETVIKELVPQLLAPAIAK